MFLHDRTGLKTIVQSLVGGGQFSQSSSSQGGGSYEEVSSGGMWSGDAGDAPAVIEVILAESVAL